VGSLGWREVMLGVVVGALADRAELIAEVCQERRITRHSSTQWPDRDGLNSGSATITIVMSLHEMSRIENRDHHHQPRAAETSSSHQSLVTRREKTSWESVLGGVDLSAITLASSTVDDVIVSR
jgi:hypothetical protein